MNSSKFWFQEWIAAEFTKFSNLPKLETGVTDISISRAIHSLHCKPTYASSTATSKRILPITPFKSKLETVALQFLIVTCPRLKKYKGVGE